MPKRKSSDGLDLRVALQQARLETQQTQEAFADSIGVPRSTIAGLETRVVDSRISTLAKIAHATGLSLDALAANKPHDLRSQLATTRLDLLTELKAVREELARLLVAVETLVERTGSDQQAD